MFEQVAVALGLSTTTLADKLGIAVAPRRASSARATERKWRRFRAWIFTAVRSRHRFVYPTFEETTGRAIEPIWRGTYDPWQVEFATSPGASLEPCASSR